MPDWKQHIRERLAGLKLDPRREAEIVEEVAQHLADTYAEARSAGASDAEAFRRALAELETGGVLERELERLELRETEPMALGHEGRRNIMADFWQDARYAFRMMTKSPGSTLVIVLTLALGIGANTAVFSVVNAVLLRPLPYPEPQRLVGFGSNESFLDLADIERMSQSLEALGGVALSPLDYTGGSEPIQLRAGLVTRGYFAVLDVPAEQGRTISSAEDRMGGERVVVLSHRFWRQQLGGDPEVLRRSIALSGELYTVIGVMPARFTGPREDPDVWAPLHVVYPAAANARGVHFLRSYARLKPGTTLAQFQTEMKTIDQRLAEIDPTENTDRRTRLYPMQERVVRNIRPALLVLFGAVGLVLLIGCANFANLLLSRVASRQHEVAVRSAMGASRSRILRQLLTESVFLTLIGGAVGLAFAGRGVELLLALRPETLPHVADVRVDSAVLLFTLALSVLTGLIFGLAPAWSLSGMNVGETLKEGGRGFSGSAGARRLRSALVVSQLAFAVLLLTGAALLLQSLWRLYSVEPGFATENLLTMRIDLPESRYREIPLQTQFRDQLLTELNTLPGVEAAMVSEIPLGGEFLMHNFRMDGWEDVEPGKEPELFTRSVAGHYFRVMHIPLLRGRYFNAQDVAGAPLVGIVNEKFVRRYVPQGDPLGKRVRWARQDEVSWVTIVGVVADVKHFGLNQEEEPALYTPYAQNPFSWKRWSEVAVRSGRAPAELAAAVKQEVLKLDPLLPVTRVHTMEQVMATSLEEQRFNALLLGIFAGLALVLAGVGIYGVMSYAVTQRTHEIGIRMALGAQVRDVLGLVVGQGMALALLGVVLGLAGAFGATRFLRTMLYGVTPTDPLTFAAVPVLLVLVALAACVMPARRAAKVDPMVALRYE